MLIIHADSIERYWPEGEEGKACGTYSGEKESAKLIPDRTPLQLARLGHDTLRGPRGLYRTYRTRALAPGRNWESIPPFLSA